jgi:hypothetical protein
MSDTATPEGTPAEGTPAAAVVDPHKPEPKLFDEAYVKSLRDEAAAARVAKKDAVDAAVKELTDKHVAELAARDVAHTEVQNELASTQLELTKIRTTLEAKVPSDKVLAFVEALKGDDDESIATSVQANLALFGDGLKGSGPAFDPTQGSGGRKQDLPLNGDPILDAVTKALGL